MKTTPDEIRALKRNASAMSKDAPLVIAASLAQKIADDLEEAQQARDALDAYKQRVARMSPGGEVEDTSPRCACEPACGFTCNACGLHDVEGAAA